ncbi:MAG: hypothetical protein Q4A78_05590 [Peptostreptococcaceae bacterium]|nr:hypothetical protein [Peptostreptococcaceae bacterium]
MKKSNKLVLIGFLVLFAVFFAGCGSKVELIDFYDVEIRGMNGSGKAKVVFDEEALIQQIAEKGKITVESMQGLFAIGSYMDRIRYDIEPSSDLKNGDMVTLKVEFTSSDADKVKLVGGEKKVKVSELPEGTVINVFEDVEVLFSGVSPNGRAEVYNNSKDDFIRSIHFTAEPSENLKVGDTVTVTANYNESTANDAMYIIDSSSKDYIVEGLDEYLHSAVQIDKETKETIVKEAQDIIEAYLVKNAAESYSTFSGTYYGEDENIDASFRFDKAYLLVAKKPESVGYGWTKNQLALFFEVRLKKRDSEESANGFVALTFNDSIVRDDRVDIVYSEGNIVAAKARRDDLERERLTAFKDKYTIEVVDLQVKQ